jgi:transposase
MKRKQDVEKARRWQNMIREAARSGLSVREFCRRRQLTISQFYWWQRRLKPQQTSARRKQRGVGSDQASFVLVSENGESPAAGIELVLGDGRRLRISRGVDEETLRAVLAALEQPAC